MLEGIQILIDRMEMFPDDFRGSGNLNDFLYILDDENGDPPRVAYYKSILTEEEITAYREATRKYHREALNRKIIEHVMEGQERDSPHKFAEKLKQSMNRTTQAMQNHLTNNIFANAPTKVEGHPFVVASNGAGGGGTGGGGTNLGGGAFVTKTGALFTPANIPKKKKK